MPKHACDISVLRLCVWFLSGAARWGMRFCSSFEFTSKREENDSFLWWHKPTRFLTNRRKCCSGIMPSDSKAFKGFDNQFTLSRFRKEGTTRKFNFILQRRRFFSDRVFRATSVQFDGASLRLTRTRGVMKLVGIAVHRNRIVGTAGSATGGCSQTWWWVNTMPASASSNNPTT